MAVYAKRPPLPYERAKKGMDLAMNVWLSAGYTTANELGLGLSGDDIDLAKTVVDHKLLGDKLDLVAFAKASVVDAVLKAAGEVAAKRALVPAAPGAPPRYVNRVRLHGVKFWMDGSMPTALLSRPFLNPPEGEPKGYKGVQVDSTAELEAAVDKWWKNGTGVVAAHVLGDGAVEVREAGRAFLLLPRRFC
jgi:predicted amidohydrolase YtcJ